MRISRLARSAGCHRIRRLRHPRRTKRRKHRRCACSSYPTSVDKARGLRSHWKMVSLVVETGNCSWPMLPLLVQLLLSQSRFGCAHQNSRIAGGMRAFAHILVNLGDIFKAAHFSEAGIDHAVAYLLVVGVGLGVVGAFATLQPLLARPEVAQIDHGRVAGGAGANYD